MKKLRWQLLVVFLALAAIAILLIGQQPNSVIPILKSTPGAIPAVQPVVGGIYSEALVGSFGRLDPVLDYYNSADSDIDRLIYSSLIRFDDHGLPEGDLADSWGISEDGTVYNFSIQPKATWHDGEPVTANDVIFTIELMRDEKIPIPADLREFWNQVDVKALNDKTIQFTLPEPFAPFMDYLSFGILPQHKLGDQTSEQIINSDFNLHPIGSGPFRFDRLEVEDGKITGVLLSAYDKYYGQKAYLQQVVFHYYDNSSAALDAFDKGDVMGVSRITADVLPRALKEQRLNLYTGRLPELTLIYFNLGNNEKKFLQDPAVRRALLTGLNREWMKNTILNGQAIIADGPIFPGTWAYYEGIEHLAYDPEAALNALKKAEYTIPAEGGDVRAKDGVPLEFELLYPEGDVYAKMAEGIQKDWKKLGVKISLKAVPYDELISQHLETGTYEAALVNINLNRSRDPDPYPFWHQAQSSGGQNYARWDDRQASEYLETARVSTDPGERTKLYRNFQVRFTNEMPALPLFYPVYSYGVDAKVRNVRMGPLFEPADRFDTITSWFLKEEMQQANVKVPTAPAPATSNP